METTKRTWLVRILTGSALGLLAGVILVPCLMSTRGAPPLVCLLCAALGGAAGVATLPFADDGRTLLLHSGLHPCPADRPVHFPTYSARCPRFVYSQTRSVHCFYPVRFLTLPARCLYS